LFSPKHFDFAEMPIEAIENIVHTWQRIYNLGNVITLITFRFLKIKEVLWVVVIRIRMDKYGHNHLCQLEKTQNNLKAYLDKKK
jgi:hypothetical protein